MPYNDVDDTALKSHDVDSKNGNLNNNNKNKPVLKLENLKKSLGEPENATKAATIVIPPDGGFAWVVMVSW
jgi:hypothetical protein